MTRRLPCVLTNWLESILRLRLTVPLDGPDSLTPDFVRSDDGAALGCAETFASGGAKFIAASSKTVNEVRPVTFKADLSSRVCVESGNDLKWTIHRSSGEDVRGV